MAHSRLTRCLAPVLFRKTPTRQHVRMLSTVQQPTLTLNNSAKQPQFGLGTWQAVNEDELRTALRVALDGGYRLIDTAHIYQNEHVIGEVLEEYFKAGKLKRSDIFITTKLPLYAMEPKDADALIPKQLAALRLEYVDLYLVHTPTPFKQKGAELKLDPDSLEPLDIEHIDTWRVLEKWHKRGALKALGVSNFNAQQIESLFKLAEVKPANVQVECYIYWPQNELVELTRRLGMTFTAYGPLGSPGRKTFRPNLEWPEAFPMEDPLVLQLAAKYQKSPAQILLRQLLQRGLAVIPKSTNVKRLKENATLFDFELSASEMAAFEKIDKRVRLFTFPFCKKSKHFPFDDVQ